MSKYFCLFQERLKDDEVKIVPMASMASLSTIRIGGICDLLVYPSSVTSLIHTLDILTDEHIPYLIVGGGSNLLMQDGYFGGVVVDTVNIKGKSLAGNIGTFDCGCMLSSAIAFLRSHRLGGAEALSGIPGTVGGAFFGNSGAFGSEISDFFLSGEFYDTEKRQILTLSGNDIIFGYRFCILPMPSLILLRISLLGVAVTVEESLARVREFNATRRRTQPLEYPSLGSVFKRYNGIGAGFYIDRVGLKGCCVGGAEISAKHAGFIINRGGARASDVKSLINKATEVVSNRMGVTLIPEIRFSEDAVRR